MRNVIIVFFIIIPSVFYAQSIFSPAWKEKPTHSYLKAHPFSDGLAHVAKSQSGKIVHGFVDNTVAIVIPLNYEDASDFNNGEAVVKNNGQWGIINKQNQTIVPFEYNELSFLLENIYLAKKDELYGVINSKNETIIPFEYDMIEVLSKTVLKAQKLGTSWLYNIKGQKLFAGAFTRVSTFNEGFATVTQNKLSGFINDKGALIIPIVYERVYPFSDGLAAVKKDGQWGYINPSNELVINYQFDLGFHFSKEVALIRNRGQWGAINKSGNIIVPTRYSNENIQTLDGIIVVKGEGFIKAFDKEGITLFRREADGLRQSYGDKLIFYRKVGRKNKHGIVNAKGDILVDIDEYERIELTEEGSFIGINDDTRTVIFEGQDGGLEKLKSDFPKFQFLELSENLRIFKEKNKYGFIDETTHIAFEPVYSQVQPFSEGLAWVKMGKKWGILYHPTHVDNPNRKDLEPQKDIVKPTEDNNSDTKNQPTETIQLVWLSPNLDEANHKTSTDKIIKIKLKAIGKSNLKLEDFQIHINGKQVSNSSRSGDIALVGTTFEASVELEEGTNQIQVRLNDAASKVYTVSYSSIRPNLYVLAIAPNFEENTSSQTLQYTDDDAKDIIQLFQTQKGKGIYQDIKVNSLISEEASAAKINKAVERLKMQYQYKEINERDVVLVFASSHGFMQDNNYYIKGDDYDPYSPTSTSVASKNLMNYLAQINCKKLLFIDACYSGGTTRDDMETKAINETIEALTNQQKGIVTFTSSTGSQKSYEHDTWKNGAFTYAITQALNGKADYNNDRKITINELNQYLKITVPKLVDNKFNELQTPQMFINGLDGDMPIFVY